MGMVVIPHNGSPYFEVYDESTLLKAVDFSMKPGANPTGNGKAAAISPDGGLVVVGHWNSPYVAVYNTATWARVTLSGGNPAGAVNEISFSPDGSLMALAHSTSPFLTVYNTTTWAKVTITGGNPEGTGKSCRFSPSGAHLAVGHSTSPFLTVYAVSGWSKVSLPTTPPSETLGVDWLPSGALVATNESQFRVYNTVDWSSELKPTSALSYAPRQIQVSPDGSKLMCSNWLTSGGPTLINVSDWSDVSFNSSPPESATRFAFIDGGSNCLFVSTQSPYLFRLNMSTLVFSGVAGSSYIDDRWRPAVGGQSLKKLGTSTSNPVRGPDGNAISGVTVRAHRRSDAALLGSATTAADGSYTLGPFMLDHGEAQVVFMDPAADPLYNDLIVRAIPA